ncbi:uncharacterized protein LACBIDRAFT_333749 [Laccaria bicolor S238N-H82]|uniref:Predicted protein n=1 Tax=Laccaria bicolor (strain S238N-H82 / ATCC MYA-4686) TaxID=486041 RepID=B0DWY3_LACBS|nr:uncharacterized protein LACBIDRAFT_333749 [Laccaria bicolor S238N-H82]EDR00840.1 predicted protein [Laccaria bicolor S238N-H82]|eukprot:XP_001888434.1 predicted protein [Laccaria bicolor S238N-H82]
MVLIEEISRNMKSQQDTRLTRSNVHATGLVCTQVTADTSFRCPQMARRFSCARMEVDLVWSSTWSLKKVLFIAQRYLPFFDAATLCFVRANVCLPICFNSIDSNGSTISNFNATRVGGLESEQTIRSSPVGFLFLDGCCWFPGHDYVPTWHRISLDPIAHSRYYGFEVLSAINVVVVNTLSVRYLDILSSVLLHIRVYMRDVELPVRSGGITKNQSNPNLVYG